MPRSTMNRPVRGTTDFSNKTGKLTHALASKVTYRASTAGSWTSKWARVTRKCAEAIADRFYDLFSRPGISNETLPDRAAFRNEVANEIHSSSKELHKGNLNVARSSKLSRSPKKAFLKSTSVSRSSSPTGIKKNRGFTVNCFGRQIRIPSIDEIPYEPDRRMPSRVPAWSTFACNSPYDRRSCRLPSIFLKNSSEASKILSDPNPPEPSSLAKPAPQPKPAQEPALAPEPEHVPSPSSPNSGLRMTLHQLSGLCPFEVARVAKEMESWDRDYIDSNGFTPELVTRNRSIVWARIEAVRQQQQLEQERQRQEDEFRAAAEARKRQYIEAAIIGPNCLRELGQKLASILNQMDAASQPSVITDLANQAAVECLKPAYDILAAMDAEGVCMQPSDVFAMQWPLEQLDRIATVLMQEQSLPSDVVDFVQGAEQVCKSLSNVLNPPTIDLSAQQMAPGDPEAAQQPPSAAPAPSDTGAGKSILLGQISIDQQEIARAVKNFGSAASRGEKPGTNICTPIKQNLECHLALAANRTWSLDSSDAQSYRTSVIDLRNTVQQKLAPKHKNHKMMTDLSDLVKNVLRLWD